MGSHLSIFQDIWCNSIIFKARNYKFKIPVFSRFSRMCTNPGILYFIVPINSSSFASLLWEDVAYINGGLQPSRDTLINANQWWGRSRRSVCCMNLTAYFRNYLTKWQQRGWRGFEPGLPRLRIRQSTSVPPHSTNHNSAICRRIIM